MPWHDWQFWVVTAIMAWGAWVLVRQLLPKKDGPACGNCAAGAAACSRLEAPAPGTAGSRPSPLRVLRD